MITMRYDADGRLVELVTRPGGQGAVTTTFRYQGDAIAQEVVGGSVRRTYVTDEAGAIVKICDPECTDPANPQYLVTWNGHGDALALWRINATDGSLTLANSYTYSTWGAPTTYNAAGQLIGWTHADNLRFRFLYVGRMGVAWDDLGLGLGLHHMGARHYSPALGRFLQPDPSALEENLYGYAEGSPVTMADPLGLFKVQFEGGGGSGGFGVALRLARSNTWASWRGLRTAYGQPLRGYTTHGLHQAIGREGHGVSPSAILDALRAPTGGIRVSMRAITYFGRNAIVAMNWEGKVITVVARHRG
jgi:RHS repeat-associated protein